MLDQKGHHRLRATFDICEKISSGGNKGQILLLSGLTFGLVTVRESTYKDMDSEITVGLLIGVFKVKVRFRRRLV